MVSPAPLAPSSPTSSQRSQKAAAVALGFSGLVQLLGCFGEPYMTQSHWGRDHIEPPNAATASASETPPAVASSGTPVTVATASASALPLAPNGPMSMTARMLAGLPVDKTLSPPLSALCVEQRNQVLSHMAHYDNKSGNAMAKWAKENVLQSPGETVFYPFSGPDFITVHRLYPDADRYVLVAVQDGGPPPDIDQIPPHDHKSLFHIYERVFESFARRGFFLTSALGTGFGSGNIPHGITGVLMAFAETEGYQVVDVTPMKIKTDGSDLELNPAPKRDALTWANVRLSLRRRSDGKPVIIDYANINLENLALQNAPEKKKWLESVAGQRVFLKAASHLPQQASFSVIRDVILNHATSILQDETGIAYKNLIQKYDVDLYGDFKHVNTLFSNAPQTGLQQAYATRKDVKPLPFSVGYQKGGLFCLQQAHQKAAQLAESASKSRLRPTRTVGAIRRFFARLLPFG